jgi:hypothetical protein
MFPDLALCIFEHFSWMKDQLISYHLQDTAKSFEKSYILQLPEMFQTTVSTCLFPITMLLAYLSDHPFFAVLYGKEMNGRFKELQKVAACTI